MSCLGCQRCEGGPVVTLITGKVVCNECPDWRLECEAREMNALPITLRRDQFRRIKERRGDEAANALWAAMQELEGD